MVTFHPVAEGHAPLVVSQQTPAPPPPSTAQNTPVEIAKLLAALPEAVRNALVALQSQAGRSTQNLMELNVQIGRQPEAVYTDDFGNKERVFVVPHTCNDDDIQLFEPLFLRHGVLVGGHNRVGIPDTLHRLSLTTHPCRDNQVIAVTARVGRAMDGVVSRMAPFLTPPAPPVETMYPPPPPRPPGPAERQPFNFTFNSASTSGISLESLAHALPGAPAHGAAPARERAGAAAASAVVGDDVGAKSLLLIGRPGVGKTTLLRELACTLSANSRLTVVVVDKTCEIAGDGESPHAAIGSARWMPVGVPGKQAQILREAVENQTPDIIICDEISTHEEVEAVRSIAQRGVRIIATVHGCTLPEIVNDGERRNLVGGQSNVTLTDAAAQARPDRRKNVAVRLREPAFEQVIELHERERWVWHPNVRDAVDAYYAGEPTQVRVLEPGRAVSAFALPSQDTFEYCLECGRIGRLCPTHIATHGVQPPSGGGGGGSGGAAGNSRNVRAGQRAGVCYGCGQPGHHRYECPSRNS